MFYHIKNNNKQNIRLLYIDILKTQNLSDFVKVFSNKILEDERDNTNWMTKLSRLISGIKASITIDEKTGAPSFVVNYQTVDESERSLESIYSYLAKQKEEYLIAFDEFQQITNYPEKNIEAILRTHIQHQHKDKFIFSGSSKHILISIFNDYGRPFYQSSEMLNLERLELDEYSSFIKEKFNDDKREIKLDLIKKIVTYLDLHTFYVQYFFNKLYNTGIINITEEDTDKTLDYILREKEFVYINYRNILTKIQYKLLVSIAKETEVSSPNSSAFIKKHDLSGASTINKTLKSLMQKEMIYKENGAYKVYDVFFSKWLEYTYK